MLCRRTNEILLYGSSFRTSTVVERERMQDLLQKMINVSNGANIFGEVILLSTCNRVELYAVSENVIRLKEIIDDRLKGQINSNSVYFMTGQDAVRHLLLVSLGMDSLLPGEEGIIHQIKSAMVNYQKTKLARSVLGSVFSSVIRSSWSLRRLYRAKAEGEEIGNIIANRVAERMGNGFNVAIIGSGRTAQEVYIALRNHVNQAYVITKRGWLPSQLSGARRASYDSLPSVLTSVNVVISATNTEAGSYLLTGSVPENLKLLVDLSVPRSIDPKIRDSGFELWDMDFMANLLKDYRYIYSNEINRALNEAADRIYYNIYFRKLDGSIEEIYKLAYKIVQMEALNAEKLINKKKYDREKVIITMGERIVKKMLEPIAEVPKDPASARVKIGTIRTLFGEGLNDKAGD